MSAQQPSMLLPKKNHKSNKRPNYTAWLPNLFKLGVWTLSTCLKVASISNPGQWLLEFLSNLPSNNFHRQMFCELADPTRQRKCLGPKTLMLLIFNAPRNKNSIPLQFQLYQRSYRAAASQKTLLPVFFLGYRRCLKFCYQKTFLRPVFCLELQLGVID